MAYRKKLQQTVKMDETATISSYFLKKSGSQNPYGKNYAGKMESVLRIENI